MNAPKSRWVGHADASRWTQAANWRGGVPAAGVNAVFRNGASWTVDLGGRSAPDLAGALIVQSDALTLRQGVLMLAPQPADQGNTFDMVLSLGAHVTVAADAAVRGVNVAEIGAKGSAGTLTVLGLVREEYGVVSNGSLEISGPRAHWLGGYSGIDLGGGSALTVHNGGTLDAGSNTFNRPASALFIGDNLGDATATVDGAGSVVREAGVVLGEGYGSGTLTISNGALVSDNYGEAGSNADGFVTVTGAGSAWDNRRTLRIGGQVPVSSSLTIGDGGAVSFGKYGFDLYGTLYIDAASQLIGHTLVSGGGVIAATAGAVTLAQAFSLSYNATAPYTTETTYLEARDGASLTLTGLITGASDNIINAASGHVTLAHAHADYGATQIYAATLEIAAKGAAAGTISFVGGDHAAGLVLDAGVAFDNLVGGFGAADVIDLRGLDDRPDISVAWTQGSGSGTLTLTSGGEQAVLHLAGNYAAADFTAAADGYGGTDLGHH